MLTWERPPSTPETASAPWTSASLHFSITLFGEACCFAQVVAAAVGTALRQGLGARRQPLALRSVETLPLGAASTDRNDSAGAAGTFGRPQCLGVVLRRSPLGERVRVRLITPLRLRKRGSLSRDLSFEHLVRAGLRRLALVRAPAPTELRDELLARAASIRVEQTDVRWLDWRRRSARQRCRMTLGGLVGEVTYAGSLAAFTPLLAALEVTHVGKQTTFGLGRIAVERVEDPA